jgi:hypothetical protein
LLVETIIMMMAMSVVWRAFSKEVVGFAWLRWRKGPSRTGRLVVPCLIERRIWYRGRPGATWENQSTIYAGRTLAS